MEEEKRRYVGIDLGKREYTMAVIGKNGKMNIHHGKTSIQGRQALYRLLEPADKIALEAGNLAFIMARDNGTGRKRSEGVELGETAFYLGRSDKDGQGRRDETGSSCGRKKG